MMRLIRQHLAARKLQRMVEQVRDSYECRRYRERRAAALKGRETALYDEVQRLRRAGL
jgi:oligoendopeptidase F